MARRLGLLTGVVGLVGASALLVYAGGSALRPMAAGRVRSPDPAPLDEPVAPPREPPEESASFHPPTGQPASLTCADARRIVRQIRGSLAYEPRPVAPAALAAATADWLDPYGLWSAAPDSPVPAALDREGPRMLDELDERASADCIASRNVGAALVRWTGELTARFDQARRHSSPGATSAATRDAATHAAEDALLDDDGRPARAVATRLGERAARMEQALGPGITPYVEAARARFFPPIDAEAWAAAVRAAVVRAYVQMIDPHGAWAPMGEEASIYDLDLDPQPPETLWDDAVRTAIGVRIDSGPIEPLEIADVVLSVAGVTTAGLPPEQLDQLVYATTDTPSAAAIVVIRRGEIRELSLPAPAGSADQTEPEPPALPAYRVPFGDGEALVVEIHEVRSDLGDALAATLRREAGGGGSGGSDPRGLLLDLRDDGGGSTEGAIAALGLFLPGARLFPMTRTGARTRTSLGAEEPIEVDRAPEPPLAERWRGPVASLVDGDTASAAEMIAGALMAYHRGAIVGERTYGKGCAQEYFDDDARAGVLRLTTLLYALPDGSPVQRVGLEPSVLLPGVGSGGASGGVRPGAGGAVGRHDKREREADDPNAPPTWRGPDVRDPALVSRPSDAAWPDHHGQVGPCPDDRVCQALRALGAPLATRPTTAWVPSAAPPARGAR